LTTRQSASLAVNGEVRRGHMNAAPKAPLWRTNSGRKAGVLHGSGYCQRQLLELAGLRFEQRFEILDGLARFNGGGTGDRTDDTHLQGWLGNGGGHSFH